MKQSLLIWLDAARPKTLPLAFASILTGSCLAFSAGHVSLTITLLAFLTATLLQILSNLANDYGDTAKGTDNDQRIGPTRAMQSGVVSQKTMKQAIGINIIFTIISGLILVLYALNNLHSILIFIALGVLAIIAAIAYTMGNKPYGYAGLGDISVFLFFGLLGVFGTYFLHTGLLEWALLLPAIGCGLFAVAVLNVNNMRDIDNDTECGKRTVAVRLGTHKAKVYHCTILTLALTSFASYLLIQHMIIGAIIFLALASIPVLSHSKAVWGAQSPHDIAPMMPIVVKCALISNLVFAGVVIAQTLIS
ncbi:1,4-dihydroxy-2-naphthoate polyprenyltransferase [Vibrio sp. 10N.286.49.B3]|uniref:1,4-dihydroxy-2-naphthoate polyprenyltransferase n=1 Tax=Vibrio sp. 10N.286.49.B3 TaxID=1880855 RepID=UPI000C81A72E|nr:1,4-dihydroxy-2-naphthoate polyprenyltransferase [Vibrio sp. 10N.286.49.B3]PMH46258.1 1,4-dihydroxy-2-naphthoate polyprenyltransferase [Vibrio sp. 10N.286.49.B3]